MKRFLILFFVILTAYAPLSAVEKFYFIIRVDDIQSRTNWEPRSITDFESVVEARGGKISWAVIPHRLIESQNSDGQLTGELKASANRGHEIVLHGYNHICPLCGQSGHEMYCSATGTHHSYEIQSGMIEDGLKILRDSLEVVPRSFVPPGHHADTTTYQVLLDYDFNLISTTGSSQDNIFEDLYSIAPHNEFTWTLPEAEYRSRLNAALNDIETKRTTQGYYCLLLHDPFIRQGYENGRVITWTGELLDSLRIRYGRGLAFVTLSEAAEIMNPRIVSLEQNSVYPHTPVLHPNYPNPFNPETTLSYTIPQGGHVSLTIFDISGKLVIRLIDGHQAAGTYSLHWDATLPDDGQSVSSGVYLSVLRQADTAISRKMILLK